MECIFREKVATIHQPPLGKVGVSVPIFEAVLRLSTTDFFDEIMCFYGFSVDDLTPNAINKIIGFKLACRGLGVFPQL